MDNVTRSVKWPRRMMAACEKRARELGYRSFNSYMKGLALYDFLCGKAHSVTSNMLDVPAKQHDKLIDKLLDDYEKGVTKHGSLFENRVKDAVAKAMAAGQQMEFAEIAKIVVEGMK